MLIFLCTEFTDFTSHELISLAMVSEDGQHEFYAERYDFDGELCSDFVLFEVLPHLGRFPAALCDRDGLIRRLWQWFATLPGHVQIATDYAGDRDLLWDALTNGLPENLDPDVFDLNPLIDDAVFYDTVCAYHNDPGQPWHHALHDAKGNRAGWEAWMAAQTDN